ALAEPRHEADRAALAHHVDAEATEARHGVGEVGFGTGDELLGPLLRHDRERNPLGLHGRHRGEIGPIEPAVDANERRRTDLDVNVRRAPLYGVAKQLIEIQHWGDHPFGPWTPPPLRRAASRPRPSRFRSARAGRLWRRVA